MKRRGFLRRSAAMFAVFAVFAGNAHFTYETNAASGRQVEALTRGLTVTALAKGTLVSWRSLGTDPTNTVFELYRGSTLIYTSQAGMPTCFADTSGSLDADYSVKVYKNGAQTAGETASAEYRLNYDSAAKGGYFDMQLDTPTDSRLGATYTANDASAADLDGDGQYELIIKWDPSNSQDNSKDGATSNVIIDAYEIEAGDAKRLWRVDLGQNIRAGAHYTQFMVYDLDGDGKAEMVCKTAPGSKDGAGNYVNTASSVSAIKNAGDNTTAYANSAGRILSGSEYLTLFDGQTGKALDTIYYEPERGDISKWGNNESYGNRVDRFLAGIAYLNGKTPSVLMCRGYYGRSVIAAYDVVDKKLSKRWIFDTNDSGNSAYAGQGNHSLTTADVDGDGYDEIVYGAMTVDHNGKGLYTSGLGHGDALHVGDLMPDREGLEIYQVYEETYGASLKDAKTGEILQRWTAASDTGRGVGDNIIAGNRSAEFCSSDDTTVYDCNKQKVADWTANITKWGQNSLIYWDGDLEREVMDRAMIDKYPSTRVFTGQGVEYNNASKSNMCLTADIFGDWREEVIARLSDGSGVRVYATVHSTDYRLFTLMHDTQYRCGVAAENVGYNQPPHVSFWLGTGDALPDKPAVYADESSEVIIPFDKGYDFSLDTGTLSADSTKGGAYYTVTGDKSGGVNRVTLDGSNMAYIEDSDTTATTNLILPIPDSGNYITVKGSFMLPAASGSWTFLQIHGKKSTGEASEIAAIRTNGGTYNLRAMGTNLTDTGVTAEAGKETEYTIVIDKVLKKAYLTIGGSTVSYDIDCKSVSEIRFITAKTERNIYAGSLTVDHKLYGDADSNGVLNNADAALILKYMLDKNTAANTVLSDFDRNGQIDMADCIKLLNEFE